MHMPPYRIERTRNRHSRALLRDDTIVIRLARGLSVREEQAHVTNLLTRMIRVASREAARTAINPFRPLLDGITDALTLALSTGERISFRLRAGKRSQARRTDTGWEITAGPSLRQRTLHRYLWKLLATASVPTLSKRIDEVNRATFDVRIGEIRIRTMSSQWGSCSTHGTITLTTALLLLPEELLRYVIIHELAHRLHRRHSPAFWNAVGSACPDYAHMRKMLRGYRLSKL